MEVWGALGNVALAPEGEGCGPEFSEALDWAWAWGVGVRLLWGSCEEAAGQLPG